MTEACVSQYVVHVIRPLEAEWDFAPQSRQGIQLAATFLICKKSDSILTVYLIVGGFEN